MAFSDIPYYGSLLQFDCQIQLVELEFGYNLVQYNQFIGEYSSLFYINGGLIEIEDNTFSYNGMTSSIIRQNHPKSLNRASDSSYFPYEQYIFKLSQDAGIFTFDYDQYDIAPLNAHKIHGNIFEHIYCERGCAYAAKGTNV